MASQEGSDGGPAQAPRLLEQVHRVMRLHHYSLHTERTYLDWIKRYIHFHRMQSRDELAGGEAKIEAFLTDLAVNGKVSASTQNQAMNALGFLYRRVLEAPLDRSMGARSCHLDNWLCIAVKRWPTRKEMKPATSPIANTVCPHVPMTRPDPQARTPALLCRWPCPAPGGKGAEA